MFQGIDALLLITGSLIFLGAAFAPISLAVFSRSDAGKRLAAIQDSRRVWSVDQLFYALGAILTALAVGLAAFRLSRAPGSLLAYLAFAALATGAAFWAGHAYQRAVDPVAFIEGALPAWPFSAYTVLTQAGLATFGAALLQSTTPAWTGWMLIAAAVLLFAAFLLFRDMPPFIYYTLTLVTGVTLFVAG